MLNFPLAVETIWWMVFIFCWFISKCFIVHPTLNTANIHRELIVFSDNIISPLMDPEESSPSPVLETSFLVASDFYCIYHCNVSKFQILSIYLKDNEARYLCAVYCQVTHSLSRFTHQLAISLISSLRMMNSVKICHIPFCQMLWKAC